MFSPNSTSRLDGRLLAGEGTGKVVQKEAWILEVERWNVDEGNGQCAPRAWW